jgi:hypothetical protein
LPLHLIPANIYLIFSLIFTLVLSKPLKVKNAYLKQHDHNPALPFSTPDNDKTITWLLPSLPETDLPLAFIPENTIPCGPIIMDFAPVATSDAELSKWLSRRPTVVINLGSLYRFDEGSARSMLDGIEYLLERVKDVQVLWKMSAEREEDAWVGEMRKLGHGDGRIRIENWIKAEMGAVLASDTVVLAVHHGGASSYHEAIWLVISSLLSRLSFALSLLSNHQNQAIGFTNISSQCRQATHNITHVGRSVRFRNQGGISRHRTLAK